jgi:hypothetical protein
MCSTKVLRRRGGREERSKEGRERGGRKKGRQEGRYVYVLRDFSVLWESGIHQW